MPEFTNQDEVELLIIGPFEGIDNTTDPYYLENGVGVDAVNIVPDRTYGSYVSAQGRVRFPGVNALPSAIMPGALFKYNQSGVGLETSGIIPYFFVTCRDNNMYCFAYNTGAPVVVGIPAGGSYAGPLPQWVTYPNSTQSSIGNDIFFADGYDQGVNVGAPFNTSYLWQILPPLNAPSLNTTAFGGGAGPLNTAQTPYFYRVTYSSGSAPYFLKESSPSPITAGSGFVNISGNYIAVSLTASSDPQVTGINVYRLGGSSGNWIQVIQNAPNTTATVNDTTPDANLTGQDLVLHRDPPPAFTSIEVHKDHVWGVPPYNAGYAYQYNSLTNTYTTITLNPNDIWFSNYQEPWGFDNTNQILPVGHNADGDNVVALASMGSLLLALKTRTTWAVYGDTGADFLVRRLFDIGCVSKYTVIKAYGQLFWLSPFGFYGFDGGDAPAYISKQIKAFLDSCTRVDLAACVGALHYRQLIWSFPTKGVTWTYDIDAHAWFKLGWVAGALFYDPNVNELSGTEIGANYVDTWFSADTDLGAAIVSSFTSRISDSGQFLATKQYRHLVVQAPQQIGSNISLQLIVNPGGSAINYTANFSLGYIRPRQIHSVPSNCTGFEAQLIMTLTSSQKTTIQKVAVTGYIKRRLIQAG